MRITKARVSWAWCVPLFALQALPACKKPDAGAASTSSTPANASGAPAPAPTPTVPPTPHVYTAAEADELLLQWDMGKVNVPADNPQSTPKIELGQRLFFDKRLSVDGSRSCYSCHQNEDGTGGHEPIAVGAANKKLTRHAPGLWNVGFLPRLHWDGRLHSLETQALDALEGDLMGNGEGKGVAKKVAEIAKIPGYERLFEAAFPGERATLDTLVQAIASYERTLVCNDSAFDKYGKGDKSALNDEQKRGLMIFSERAKCDTCHTPPFFSNTYLPPTGAFFNIGIGTEDKDEKDVDVGRMGVTKNESDWAAFKPPSLRNVANSPPYFHDGSRPTLEAAVRFMAGGGHDNKNHSPVVQDKKLSDEEIHLIVSFLGSLSCTGKLTPPKKLP
jgi:cytochrome c peroxidase